MIDDDDNMKSKYTKTQYSQRMGTTQMETFQKSNLQQFPPNYTDKLLWTQSSSTWLHGTPNYAFSKSSRFIKTDNSKSPSSFLQIPSMLSKKSTKFGKSLRGINFKNTTFLLCF